MPLINCSLNEVTDELAIRLEQEITASIREAVARAFPPELGYKPGTPEYEIGLEVSRKIMPGWTWVSVSNDQWCVRGQRVKNAIAARINILVLENALETRYKDHILEAVTMTVKKILSASGKPVHMAISITEGGVDMTLPRDLFDGLTHGDLEELLQVENVVAFLKAEIQKELQSRSEAVR